MTVNIDVGATASDVLSRYSMGVTDWASGPADYATVAVPTSLKISAEQRSATGTMRIVILESDFAEENVTAMIGASAEGLGSARQELTITDDELLSVTLRTSVSRIPEFRTGYKNAGRNSGRLIKVTATVDGGRPSAVSQTVMVSVGALEDSAEEGTDYEKVPNFAIMIPAGKLSAAGTFRMRLNNDVIAEGSETLSVTGVLSGGTVTPTAITIIDYDVASEALVLTISPESLDEGPGTALIEFKASLNAGASPTENFPVTISVTGETADSADYRVISVPGPLVIPAGQRSVTDTVRIEILEDNLAEKNETIMIRASTEGLDSASQKFTITDDAPPLVTLSISQYPSLEVDPTLNLVVYELIHNWWMTVTATVDGGRPSAEPQTVIVSVGAPEDSAEEGADYEAVEDFEITIPPGAPSATGTFVLNLPGLDGIVEGNETLSVAGSLDGETGMPVAILIRDWNDKLRVTLINDKLLYEGNTENINFRVWLNSGMTAADDIPIGAIVSSTYERATPTDYRVISVPGPLVIPAGENSITATVQIEFLDDDLAEGNETIRISFLADSHLGGVGHILLIKDNDVTSDSLVLTISPESVEEDAGMVSIEVTASLNAGASPTENFSVTINVTDGTADFADYRVISVPGPLVIPAGQRSVTGTVEIEVLEDDIAEADETIVIGASATGLASTSQNLVITANDASLSVTLSVSPPIVAEDVETAMEMTVTATVDGDRMFVGAQTVTVSVGASTDSAEEGTDYAVVDDFMITIPGGSSSATGGFTLDLTDDDLAEGSETVGVAGLLSGRTVTPAQITITDNDAKSDSLLLTISPENVGEDAGMVSIEVTASLNAGTSTESISVMVSVMDGTAESGDDYRVVLNPSSLEIPAGMASVMGTVEIEILEDDFTEEDETIVIGASATGLTPASEELTITDDDVPSTALLLTISPESLGENAGTSKIEITASLNDAVRSEATSVTVSVADGTALLDDDYRVVSIPSPLEIPVGMASVMGMVEMEVLEDDLTEEDETIVIGVSATDLAPASQDLMITDDDALLSVTLSVSPSRVAENVGTASVATVTATVDGDRVFVGLVAVTVSVGTPGDSAEEGTDYAAVEDFTITIPAGDASATGSFTLDPINDDLAEGSETVSVAGALVGRTVTPAQLTIIDDDVQSKALVLTIRPESVREDAGTREIQVTASLNGAARPAATAVTVSVADGTAKSGDDYRVVSIPSPLEIPVGDFSITGTVEIEVLEDDVTEEDETIVIGVSATDLAPASQDLVITANDASLSVTLEVSPSRVAEDVGR